MKYVWGFPGGISGKESVCQCRRHKRHGFNPWVGKIPWRRKWQPAPVFLPGKYQGRGSLVSYSPWGHKESDTTERAPTIVLCIYVTEHVNMLYIYIYIFTLRCSATLLSNGRGVGFCGDSPNSLTQ